jgi:hypothetical protein
MAALVLMLGFTAAVAQQAPQQQKPEVTKTPVAGQMVTQPADTILARDLIGQTVLAPDNAKIGSISDLLLSRDAKNVEGFVIGIGGFLGIGERNVALKIDQLKITPQPDGTVKLVMDARKDDLANAPPFKSRRDIEAEKRAAERPTAPQSQQRPAQYSDQASFRRFIQR